MLWPPFPRFLLLQHSVLLCRQFLRPQPILPRLLSYHHLSLFLRASAMKSLTSLISDHPSRDFLQR
eukprot:UN18542